MKKMHRGKIRFWVHGARSERKKDAANGDTSSPLNVPLLPEEGGRKRRSFGEIQSHNPVNR